VTLLVAVILMSGVPLRASNPKILFENSHESYAMDKGELDEYEKFLESKGYDVEKGDMGDLFLYRFVIITTPGKDFSKKEISSLKSYVEAGGTLFIAGQSDFKNHDNSELMNKIMRGIGSGITFNDDEATDEKENCGKPYCVVSRKLKDHALTKGVESLSFYSSQTLLVSGDVERVATGNPSTRSEDSDGNKDNLPISGNDITLLALEHVGNGNVIASGAWHLFDNYNFTKRQETIVLAENIFSDNKMSRNLPSSQSKNLALGTYKSHFGNAVVFIGENSPHGAQGAARDEVDLSGAEKLAEATGIKKILRDSEGHTYSGDIVLVGGPAVNALTEAVNPYLPIKFSNDGKWYLERNGKKYYGREFGIVATIEIGGRKVLVVAGLGGTGTAGAIKVLQNIERYDLSGVVRNEYGESILVQVSGDTNGNGIEEEQWSVEII